MISSDPGEQPVSVERMTQKEVPVALEWAKREGWNPGVHDAECFFNADPDGFYAAKIAGETVGTVSAVKYSEDFAFEGLLIVKPEFRGKGIGLKLQRFVNDLLVNINVGLDGVLPMQQKYWQVGFKFAYKNTRYAGKPAGNLSDSCLRLCKSDFVDVVSFDASFFPAARPKFLRCWLFQKNALALLVRQKGSKAVGGYGVIRECAQGHKIGPLFARTPSVAEALFKSLFRRCLVKTCFWMCPNRTSKQLRLRSSSGFAPFSAPRGCTRSGLLICRLNRFTG
jgi:hypothetical protein